MKNRRIKLFFFIAFFFVLSGCMPEPGDTSDSASDSPETTPEEVIQKHGEGQIRVALMQQTGVSSRAFDYPPEYLNETSTVRVIVTNAAINFSAGADYPVPSVVDATIPVPVADGYKIRSISFSSENTLLKYSEVENISVAADETTTVNLILENIEAGLDFPAQVNGGETFTVTIDQHPALKGFMYLSHTLEPTLINRSDTYTSRQTVSVTPPSSTEEVPYYFRAIRFMADDLLLPGDDHWSHFEYYYPQTENNAGQASTTIIPATGGIGVGIEY